MATSRTAEYVALYRALETNEPGREPLFRDPFATLFLRRRLARLLPLTRVRPVRAVLERYADWRAPGARSSAIGRTRFIDDVVRRAVADDASQLVILGAGYDCRAHRLAELRQVPVFEVDRPEIQAAKRARVEAGHLPGTRRDVTYVPVDFGTDDVASRLASSGWDRARPSVVLWEGVTNYLTETSVSEVLGFVGSMAAGTTLIFTYIHRGVLDGSSRFAGAQKLVRSVRKLGEPWTFGLVPGEVPTFVARFGLTLLEDLGADEYRQRYLRAGAGGLRGYAFYRIAVTRVTKA